MFAEVAIGVEGFLTCMLQKYDKELLNMDK